MKTDAYEAIKGRFLSREWRLDNLYFIQNERGEVVRFVRNESQRAFWDNAWYLNAILKARQLGFSTLMALLELDTCLFNSNISAGIVDYSLVDAKKKLARSPSPISACRLCGGSECQRSRTRRPRSPSKMARASRSAPRIAAARCKSCMCRNTARSAR